MSALLEVTDLKVHFPVRRGVLMRQVGSVKAVDGVSFAVGKGETLGLVGESGCGKSTTARAILRLIPATGGSAKLEGTELLSLRGGKLRAKRRDMQMVFQDPYASLNPRMTVFDILAEPLIVHGVAKGKTELEGRVQKLMSQVGLSPAYMRRYPHEFSGGQRQRIGIARAVALKPKLVLLDEPVSALDVSIQAQILNLLVDLQEQLGLTYVFVAHDLAVVRHVCKSIAVMYLGRIVERTTTERLFKAPKHPYTQALLSAIPIPDPVREKKRRRLVLSGEVPSPLNPPPGCHFHTRCPVAVDKCKKEVPRLEPVEDGHMVSCHVVKDRGGLAPDLMSDLG
ncbi:MAG: dipeptide ABC transporter ATP-binding protein [Polyangiaceae bacterium]|nr:dipeptide ABC transporter ATP-binding protein [Polyangiaceae bacterium]